MLKNLLLMKSFPVDQDAALLALRVFTLVPLFLRHGIEKLFTFSAMANHFPDPLYIGVVPGLLFATFSDSICSMLIVVGVATRWAALVVFLNIAVAWAFVHHFQFFGPAGDHGELIVLYLGIALTLVLAGPGKYSIDRRIDS